MAADGRNGRRAGQHLWHAQHAGYEVSVIKNDEDEKVRITHSGFIPLMMSHKKKVRRAAFEGLYGTYQKFENTFPAIYQASVQGDVFYARAGKFASALEAGLFLDNAMPLAL